MEQYECKLYVKPCSTVYTDGTYVESCRHNSFGDLLIHAYISVDYPPELAQLHENFHRGCVQTVINKVFATRGKPFKTVRQLKACDYHQHAHGKAFDRSEAHHVEHGLPFEL